MNGICPAVCEVAIKEPQKCLGVVVDHSFDILNKVSSVYSNAIVGVGAFHLYTIGKMVQDAYLGHAFVTTYPEKMFALVKAGRSNNFLVSSTIMSVSSLLYLGINSYSANAQNDKVMEIAIASLAIAQHLFLAYGNSKDQQTAFSLSVTLGGISSLYSIGVACKNAFDYLTQSLVSYY